MDNFYYFITQSQFGICKKYFSGKICVASKDKSRVIEVAVSFKLTQCYEFVTISNTISSFKEGAVPARQWM